MSFDPLPCLVATGLAATCLTSTGIRSLGEFSRRELEEICRRRGSRDRLGRILRGHERVAIGAETLRMLAIGVSVTAAVFWFARQFPADGSVDGPVGWLPVAGAVVGAAVGLLAAAIWIPWAVARLWAAGFLYFTWPVWNALSTALFPLELGARFVDVFLHRLVGRTPAAPNEESFEDEIRTIVTEGHREGLLENDAREMIEGVIELSDVDVSEIMTPRTDMTSVPVKYTWSEALTFIIASGHTRIPAHEKSRDDVVGILYVKDLLPVLAAGENPPAKHWTSLLREPHFVPETKPVDVLLQEFQRERTHMVVVLDEYGGVSGLVTMEDVLEEIVGEINDEYDKDLVDGIREIDETTAEALGKVHVDEVNQRLNIDLPDDGDFDTIGGFVFSELGHVPVVGEELARKNVRITVLEATPRRIERLRIEILDRGSGEM